MRAARLLSPLLLLALLVLPARAADDAAAEWAFFGRMLALVQTVVHAAAHSPDPQAAQKEVDAMLSGKNAEANRLARELADEAAPDMPPAVRDSLAALARDLAVLARREQARAAAQR